jgi:TonB-linked SusC/RagA family outer membrane protein
MYKIYTRLWCRPEGYVIQFLRIMKILIVVMTVFLTQVSAATFAQKITLNEKKASLVSIFEKINKQSGIDFLVDIALIAKSKPVDINVKNEALSVVLDKLFEGQPLYYIINDGAVMVKEKESSFLDRVVRAFASIDVRGRVVDAEGSAIPGATVKVKGTNKTTVTDAGGSFSLTNVDETAVLVISYVGFGTMEIKAGRNLGNIIMQISDAKLDEVNVTINTGYQSISKERATGSYSSITAKQLENKLKPDLKSAMEGLAAGMVLTKEGSIEVRGVSTFLTGAQRAPLVVVDGFPISGGLETINVDQVETVTVLKDAVAASIYGARSSNGVIVITTKSGKKGAVSVDYKGSIGMISKPDLSYLNRASAADYIDAELAQFTLSPTTPTTNYNNYRYLSNVTYLAVAKSLGLITTPDFDSQIAKLKSNDGLTQLQDHLVRTQISQQHNVSVSGGGDKSQMLASAKLIDNRGSSLYTNDKRLILDWKNGWKPTKSISVNLLANMNYSQSEAPVRSVTSLLDYTFGSFLHPYDLAVDPVTGDFQNIFATNPRKTDRYALIPGLKTLEYNPLEDLGKEMTKNQNLQIRLGGNVNVILADGLSVEGGGTWTRGNNFTRSIYSKDTYRMRLAYDDGTSVANPTKHYIPDGDMLTESRDINQSYTLRGQLNYNKTFGKHSVMAIAGTEVSRSTLDNNAYPTRFGYNDQAGTFAIFNYADYSAGLYNADMLAPQTLTAGIGSIGFQDNRFSSFYGNASYEFDRRFLVSGSIRLDLTNFFGTDPKYRYKPIWSVGGTYKVSNEQYFNVPWMNKFYLRGSYGLNGNIDLNSGPFLIIAPAAAVSLLTGDIPYTISSPPNNSLRWEKTVTTNLGTDISFFKSRLNMTFDYYLRRSQLLLATDRIDPTRGYSSLTRNVGQLNNTGLELTLEGDALRKKDFVWNVLGTVSYNNNKVITYNANYSSPLSLVLGPVNRIGYPGSALFSYRFAGINNAGSPTYFNNAGEAVIGANIKADDLTYSGTTRPKFTYSLTNTFRYQSFDLAFMLIAKTGYVVRRSAFFGDNYIHKDVGKRWKSPGDEYPGSLYPKLSSSGGESLYFSVADAFVESGNFLKLRDVSLSYHFDKKMVKRIGLADASLIIQGRNLFLLSANSDIVDPEAFDPSLIGSNTQDRGFSSLPPRPEFYLGLKVNF